MSDKRKSEHDSKFAGLEAKVDRLIKDVDTHCLRLEAINRQVFIVQGVIWAAGAAITIAITLAGHNERFVSTINHVPFLADSPHASPSVQRHKSPPAKGGL